MFADRREVVELGAGVSTIVLARLMRERGGRIASVEHEPAWAALVRRELERDGLDSVATLVEAPLAPHPAALGNAPWYAPEALDALPESGIELLLVDGPPGYGEGMALSRYPALPVLADRLAPGALVALDDAERDGEREVLQRWERELPGWNFAVRGSSGLAIGARG